jgi:hypothetical protein
MPAQRWQNLKVPSPDLAEVALEPHATAHSPLVTLPKAPRPILGVPDPDEHARAVEVSGWRGHQVN